MEPVFYPDILPDIPLQGEEPAHDIFVPLYLNQRTVGYLWISTDYCMQETPMVYAMLTVMNSSVIDLCLLKEKDSLVEKLDSMYVRDELTKLYNRFGMRRYVEKILQVAKRDGKHIMCIEMDLDGLKRINEMIPMVMMRETMPLYRLPMRCVRHQSAERSVYEAVAMNFWYLELPKRKVMQDHLSAEWRIVLMSITAGIGGRIRLRAVVDIMYAVPVRSILLRRW